MAWVAEEKAVLATPMTATPVSVCSELVPNTGDAKLDELLREAHTRFLSRNPQNRMDALEKLWDAFERLKSLENSANKGASIHQLLAKAAGGDAQFQHHLNAECKRRSASSSSR